MFNYLILLLQTFLKFMKFLLYLLLDSHKIIINLLLLYKLMFNHQKIFIVFAFCACLCLGIKVDTNSTLFLDQFNRYTVFHGVNVVFKTEPFYPQLDHFSSNFSLTDMDLQNLRDWGFNMIRLHVAWEGVQPHKGEYNYTYIEVLRSIVQKCNKYGIYVLLDSHQDLYSKKFCGEGFPDWAVTSHNFPFPININMQFDQKGYPKLEDCLKIQFALFYTSQDIMRFQEDFFTNKDGIFDHFVGMWERVAAYMSKEPNLLGYEIVNQPIGANVYKDPASVLLPGGSNNKYLKPAYEKAYKGIRKFDPVNLIFYQPSILDPLGGGFYEPLGQGDEKQKQRQVFSYHIYCPYVTKLGEPVSPLFCSDFDQLQVASKQLNTQSLKVGAFLTEYGALSNSEKSAGEITVLTDLMTQYFRSWCYWQFKYYNDITTAARPGTTQSFYDENGFLQQRKVKALARPYAYAICGTPIEQKFKKGIYSLKWYGDRQCFNKNTEIFLSTAFYFPLGFNHVFSNCKDCQLKALSNQGYYQIAVPQKRHQKLKITITPIQKSEAKNE